MENRSLNLATLPMDIIRRIIRLESLFIDNFRLVWYLFLFFKIVMTFRFRHHGIPWFSNLIKVVSNYLQSKIATWDSTKQQSSASLLRLVNNICHIFHQFVMGQAITLLTTMYASTSLVSSFLFLQGLGLVELTRSIGRFDSHYSTLADESTAHFISRILLKASRIRNLTIQSPIQRVLRIIQKAMRKNILVDEFYFYHEYLDYSRRFENVVRCYF